MNWTKTKYFSRPGIGTRIAGAAGGLALLLTAGCGGKPQTAAAPPPPEVGVVTIQTRALPITTDLPGRIDPVRTAEVRARVAGILLKQVFKEGSDVREGDTLFQIDPAPLQARLDSAQAALAKAEANVVQAQSQAERDEKLVKIRAVSQQEYDNAKSAAQQGQADVLVAKAAVETASLNLGYATVTAPISGRIGRALVTEGALVGQDTATELAVIQQLDPIYFDFTESSTEGLKLWRAFRSGQLKSVSANEAQVTLLLDDGSTYSHPGKLLFSDVTVDPTTGMITLRAKFPNPDHLLLPGMFAHVRLEQAMDNAAITVPQRGVTYGPSGEPTVMLVNTNDEVVQQPVAVRSAEGNQWIITAGLKTGDRVVVSGLQKIQPGMKVKPVPFAAGATNAAPDEADHNE
jgi:membrane fusion protein (multidrug efflux system)